VLAKEVNGDVALKKRLKRLPKKEAQKHDPHGSKDKSGRSKQNLYRDPKTGKIYAWSPRGEPEWVAGP
jgi:hypothetical protein